MKGRIVSYRIKATKMWADMGEVERSNHGPLTPVKRYATQSEVYVIPVDAYDKMVERMTDAQLNHYPVTVDCDPVRAAVVSSLAAIGIKEVK